jgi:hypothetical protein
MEIGISIAAFQDKGVALEEMVKIVKDCQAEAIELSFRTIKELENIPEAGIIKAIEDFDNIYIHPPYEDINYGFNIETVYVVNKLRYFNDIKPLSGIIIQTDKIINYDYIKHTELPFLIKNPQYKDLKSNKQLLNQLKIMPNFNFVFDTYNAFSDQPDSKVANELLEDLSDRLGLVHLRGSNGLGNSLVHLGENLDYIKALKFDAPIILKGNIPNETSTYKIKNLLLEECRFVKGLYK